MSIQDFFDNMEDDCRPSGHNYFSWSAKGFGFGGFHFYTKENDDTIYCENEMMSKEFVKKMLCHMVDNAVMDDPNPKDNE